MTAVWNDKLITRAQAADMCGSWMITIDNSDYEPVYLRCSICKGNITKLPPAGQPTSVDMIITVVLRHMCSAHDYPLSGARNEGIGNDSPAAGNGSSRNGSHRPAGDAR